MEKVSRRVFLTVISTAGAAAATGLLAACGAKKEFTCTDTAGLSAEEKTMRDTVKYVDRSTTPGKKCENCQQFKPAAAGQCGGCNVVKGPIHPDGFCTLWSQKAG